MFPYSDLRQFLAILEEHGHLKRIKVEVDWNLRLARGIATERWC